MGEIMYDGQDTSEILNLLLTYEKKDDVPNDI